MPRQCPFCKRVNPSDAKFCNACGAPWHLPCPQCGAVNDAAATTCHQCSAPLLAAGQGAPEPSPAASQPTRSGAAGPSALPEAEALDARVSDTLQELRHLPPQTESAIADRGPDRANPGASPQLAWDAIKARTPPPPDDVIVMHYPTPAVTLASELRSLVRSVVLARPTLIVAGALLLVAAFGYLASGERQTAALPRPPAAAGEVKGSGGVAETDSGASLATASEAAPTAAPTPVPVVTPGVAPNPQPPAAASDTSSPLSAPAPASVAPARQANATASTRPRAPETGTEIERPAPHRIGPCTDAVAALGLCTQEATQRRE
jgi:hypothetical protein